MFNYRKLIQPKGLLILALIVCSSLAYGYEQGSYLIIKVIDEATVEQSADFSLVIASDYFKQVQIKTTSLNPQEEGSEEFLVGLKEKQSGETGSGSVRFSDVTIVTDDLTFGSEATSTTTSPFGSVKNGSVFGD